VILVRKGAQPKYLEKVSPEETRKMESAFDNGRPLPKADPKKYGHASVRAALSTFQHGKCCYCEVKIPKPYAYAHVEHYRPKSSTRQGEASKPEEPGYYWLSYDWDNLFLSCMHCNSAYKGDLFPLGDDADRALNHHFDIARERPLVLRPSGPEDPESHIEFIDDRPVGLDELGRMTIKVAGLDCPEREDRREYLDELRYLRDQIVDFLADAPTPANTRLIKKNREALIIAQRSSEKYSAMVREFIRHNPIS